LIASGVVAVSFASKVNKITNDQIKGTKNILQEIMTTLSEHRGLFGTLHESTAQKIEDAVLYRQ
jgi:hypothetical protein